LLDNVLDGAELVARGFITIMVNGADDQVLRGDLPRLRGAISKADRFLLLPAAKVGAVVCDGEFVTGHEVREEYERSG